VRVQQGEPAGVILLHAGSSPFDLLVLGSHRRTGLGRMRRGSIAERVLQQAAQPVLIVPASGVAAPRPSFADVLVGVDMGAAATAAVAHARLLTVGSAGRVTMLHVTRRVPAAVTDGLQRHLGPYVGAELVDPQIVAGDTPAGIARIAAAMRPDLIVLGVTRRGPIARWLHGATAVRVLRATACPILAVPERAAAAPCASPGVHLPLAA
jgi:nucleotide-binding universal stress UspA family protein